MTANEARVLAKDKYNPRVEHVLRLVRQAAQRGKSSVCLDFAAFYSLNIDDVLALQALGYSFSKDRTVLGWEE